MVWRPDPDGPQSVGVFARIMGAPGDRNLVNFSVNGGITLKAPFDGRDNDTVGLGFGFAKISPSAIRLDRDQPAATALPDPRQRDLHRGDLPVPGRPLVAVQPDFQYVFTPAGGIPNPLKPGKRIGNAATFGVRTNIVF